MPSSQTSSEKSLADEINGPSDENINLRHVCNGVKRNRLYFLVIALYTLDFLLRRLRPKEEHKKTV
jgi:hypothetical protein